MSEENKDEDGHPPVRRKEQKKRDTIHLNIQLTSLEDKLLTDYTQGIYGARTLIIRGLLRKFLNPLRCRRCRGNMRDIACIERRENIAWITNYQTLKSRLKHSGEKTVRPPPLRVKTPTTNIPDTAFWDSIPPVEAYFYDTEYAN